MDGYRYADEAQARLLWVVPLTLLIMFALLMLTFKSLSLSLIILLSTPFALIGSGIISSTIYVLFLIPCLFVIGDDLRKRLRN